MRVARLFPSARATVSSRTHGRLDHAAALLLALPGPPPARPSPEQPPRRSPALARRAHRGSPAFGGACARGAAAKPGSSHMKTAKVLVSDKLSDSGLNILRSAAGIEVDYRPG